MSWPRHRPVLRLPEISLGIYPGLGGTQRSRRKLGIGMAKWLIYTCKILSAADAWKIGLLAQVIDRAAVAMIFVPHWRSDKQLASPARP